MPREGKRVRENLRRGIPEGEEGPGHGSRPARAHRVRRVLGPLQLGLGQRELGAGQQLQLAAAHVRLVPGVGPAPGGRGGELQKHRQRLAGAVLLRVVNNLDLEAVEHTDELAERDAPCDPALQEKPLRLRRRAHLLQTALLLCQAPAGLLHLVQNSSTPQVRTLPTEIVLQIERVLYVPTLLRRRAAQRELVDRGSRLIQANAHRMIGPIERFAKKTEKTCEELPNAVRVPRRLKPADVVQESRLPAIVASPLRVNHGEGNESNLLKIRQHWRLHRLQEMDDQQNVSVAVQATVRTADKLVALRPFFYESPKLCGSLVAAAIRVEQLGVAQAEGVAHAKVHLCARVHVRELDEGHPRLKHGDDVGEVVLWQQAGEVLQQRH
mmetsp:Transcript_103230/g.272830  ORF Transcript_103230/g.272830 Transcript_103230/m.272830 type:complete len:382 (+) Transcript_103230:134-1279(+)